MNSNNISSTCLKPSNEGIFNSFFCCFVFPSLTLFMIGTERMANVGNEGAELVMIIKDRIKKDIKAFIYFNM